MKIVLNRHRFLLTLLGFNLIASLTAQEKNFIDQPYLETNVRVDTLVVPDRIYLNIQIREEDTKGRTSVEVLENRMAVKLKALGIDLDKQLTLSDLASDFRDYFLRKTDVQKSKSYTLVVYDALTAGKVIRELEAIEISNISLQRTEFSAMDALQTRLRTNAVARARQQALALLDPIEGTLGNVLQISDHTPYNNSRHMANMNMALQEDIQGRGYAAEAQPIDIYFEKIPAEASVSVKFAIR
jgi:uncharacterized protein YggE